MVEYKDITVENKEKSKISLIVTTICLVFFGAIFLFKGEVIQGFLMNEIEIKSLNALQSIGFSLLLISSILYVFYLKRYKVINNNKTSNWGFLIFIGSSFLFILIRNIVTRFIGFDISLGCIDSIGALSFLLSTITLIILTIIHLVLKLRKSFKVSTSLQSGTLMISIFALLISAINILF